MKHTRISARVPRLGRLALGCAVAVALVGSVASCAKDEPAATGSTSETTTDVLAPEGDPVDGGTLVVGMLNDVTGWNPTADQWGLAAAFAGSSFMESLTTLDAESRPQPWLATEWTPNDDFTSWTLKLRDDVTFHNGEKFNAVAVQLNMIDVVASPLTGIALGGAIETSEIIDEYTIRIDLKDPWAAFPSSFLAGPNAWMRAPAMLGPDANGTANPIGTGPFKFESWEPGAALKLAKYDDYWRDGEPHLDNLEFVPIVDDISRVNALESGDVDMMLTTSARDAADLEAKGETQVIKDWDTEATLLVVNTRETADGQPNPLSNEHARKAIAYATDPTVIAGLVGEGLEIATSPFAADNPWSDPAMAEAYPSYDVEKAKEEVQAYKDETGESTLRVKVLGPTETNTIAQLQALDQQWAEAGIETQIDTMEHSAYSLQGVQGKFQLIFGPIFSAPDPDQNYHFWSETTVKEDGAIGINFAAYATDSSQAALEKGRRTETERRDRGLRHPEGCLHRPGHRAQRARRLHLALLHAAVAGRQRPGARPGARGRDADRELPTQDLLGSGLGRRLIAVPAVHPEEGDRPGRSGPFRAGRFRSDRFRSGPGGVDDRVRCGEDLDAVGRDRSASRREREVEAQPRVHLVGVGNEAGGDLAHVEVLVDRHRRDGGRHLRPGDAVGAVGEAVGQQPGVLVGAQGSPRGPAEHRRAGTALDLARVGGQAPARTAGCVVDEHVEPGLRDDQRRGHRRRPYPCAPVPGGPRARGEPALSHNLFTW
jgi:peptide/nickel transport system substrate-binding protein